MKVLCISEKKWELLRESVKRYISTYFTSTNENECRRRMKLILAGLLGKDNIPSSEVRTWIIESWIRGTLQNLVAEFIIVWKYTRIDRRLIVVEKWPWKVMIPVGLKSREIKQILREF